MLLWRVFELRRWEIAERLVWSVVGGTSRRTVTPASPSWERLRPDAIGDPLRLETVEEALGQGVAD